MQPQRTTDPTLAADLALPEAAAPALTDELEPDPGAEARSRALLAHEVDPAAARAFGGGEVGAALVGDMLAAPTVDLPHAGAFGDAASAVTTHGGPALGASMQRAGVEGLTYGDHVAFASPSPGAEVVQHELAHVAQQAQGPGDRAADEAGAHAAEQMPAAEVGAMVSASAGSVTSPVARFRTGPEGAAPAPAPTAETTPATRPIGFEVAAAAPGEALITVGLDLAALPRELRAAIPPELEHVSASLRVDGVDPVLALTVGAEVWIARVDARAAIEALVGGAAEAMAQIGDVVQFWKGLVGRVTASGGRVKVPLWGQAPEDSFAVLDLARVAAGLGKGSAAGFRPVEAQLLLGKVGGVRVFGGDEVPATTAVPGDPIGDWFAIPDDGTIRRALGLDGKGEVFGGVFYADGVLRVAVKPTAEAQTGVVAHVDLVYLLEQLKKLGAKAAEWIDKLLARIKAGATDFFKAVKGLLRFELPDVGGSWFEFDFRLQLPRLFKGGGGGGFGFDLSGLWPTGFHFDLGGLSFGALPKLQLPWLKSPKLGGFKVAWPDVAGLFGGFPSLSLPSLPDLELDLHLAGDLSLGLGLDLSKLWPELGDLGFGIELDLRALLEKIQGAGEWLLKKLEGAANWVKKWIHLGSDGVLRIYDAADPAGPMLGFHLLRLLDGAQATDLTPTEIRWQPGKDDTFSMELGEAAPADGPAADAPKGKAAPRRPEGTTLVQKQLAAPPSLATAMALTDQATVDAALIWDGADHLTVWAEAKSAVYEGNEAARATVNLARVKQAIARLPAAKGVDPASFPILLDQATSIDGPSFLLGEAAAAAGAAASAAKKALSGHVGWKLERLLGAGDWTALVPDTLELHVEGAGGVQLGKLAPPAPVLDPPGRFELAAPTLRQKLLLANDDESSVFAGVHLAPDIVAVSLTKTADGDEGALAQVHLSFLLRQLERLGKLGRAILDKLGEIALPSFKGGGGGGDIFARLAELAEALREKFMKVVDGLLSIDLPGGGFLRWNLKAQLPHLGLDFDLSKLVPDFQFDLPALPELSLGINFQLSDLFKGDRVGGFSIPWDGVSKWLDGIPSFPKLPKLAVNVDWLGDLLGVSIDLGNLFGDGNRSFGFTFPFEKLLAKAGKAADWLMQKLGKARDLARYVHVGSDGVLRIYDPAAPDGNRIGFDLTRLFDGVSPDDLVPVEVHAELDVKKGGKELELAEISFGDKDVDDKDKQQAGKVLVPRPKADPIASASLAAPGWLTEHLAAPDGARLRASLFLEGDDAIAFASVDGSDRGLELRIHATQIAKLAEGAGPIKAPSAGGGFHVDQVLSAQKDMLVVGFGEQRKPGQEPTGASGHVGWRLPRLLQDPSFGSLVPDELHVDDARGGLTLAQGFKPDAGLTRQPVELSLAGLPDVQAALGDRERVEVWTDLEGDLRLVLVARDDQGGAPLALEVDVRAKFARQIQQKLATLAGEVSKTVGKAFRKTSGAGAIAGGKIKFGPDPAGLRVERGKDGDPDHVYATFGWRQLVSLASGDGSLEDLVPVELRVATKTMSLEVEQLDDGELGKPLPTPNHPVGGLHELLKEPLHQAGLADDQVLVIDGAKSRARDEGGEMIDLVGHVYDSDDGKTIAGGKQLSLGVSLDALLAQVLPKKRTFGKKAKKKLDPKNGRTKVSAYVETSSDLDHDGQTGEAGDQGVEMGVDFARRNSQGNLREFQIQAGWTWDQIVQVLLNLDDLIDDEGKPTGKAAGLLAPKHLHGSFSTDKFELGFGNDGKPSEYNTEAHAVPGLGALLQTVLDAETARAARIHLNLPDSGELASAFKKAISEMSFIQLAGCSLEVPSLDGPKFYEITFAVSPVIFKRLLYLIPYAGTLLKLLDAAVSIAKDPAGTLESLAYTPEALVQLVEFAPDIYDALKDKSWKDIALGIAFNDGTTKQAVMAGRIYKKLKAAGYQFDKSKPPGNLGDIPVEYLEWLSKQDPAALAKFMEYGETLEKMGIETDTDDESKLAIPSQPLNAADLEVELLALEKGYTEFAQAKKQADATKDPAATEALKEHSEALRKRITKLLHAGAKPSQVVDRRGEGTPVDKLPETKDRDFTDVTGLPQPDPKDEKLARSLFDASEGQVIHVIESDYLVMKYAALSTDQLGELLATGSTRIETKTGPITIPMFEEERGFVRTLFLRKVDPTGKVIKRGDATSEANTADTDAKLIAAWRSGAMKQDGAEGAEPSATAKPRQPGDPATSPDPGAQDKGKGEGDGGEGEGELADIELGEDDEWQRGTQVTGGDSEMGAVYDGERNEADAADGETGGQAGRRAGGEVDPKINDKHLLRLNNDDGAELASYDPEQKQMVAKADHVAYVIANFARASSKGYLATITAIDVVDQGESVSGKQKFQKYTVNLTVAVPTEKLGADGKPELGADGLPVTTLETHVESFVFFYNLKTKSHRTTHTDWDLMDAKAKAAAEAGYDPAKMVGKKLVTPIYTMNIIADEGVEESGKKVIASYLIRLSDTHWDGHLIDKHGKPFPVADGQEASIEIDMTAPGTEEETSE